MPLASNFYDQPSSVNSHNQEKLYHISRIRETRGHEKGPDSRSITSRHKVGQLHMPTPISSLTRQNAVQDTLLSEHKKDLIKSYHIIEALCQINFIYVTVIYLAVGLN